MTSNNQTNYSVNGILVPGGRKTKHMFLILLFE